MRFLRINNLKHITLQIIGSIVLLSFIACQHKEITECPATNIPVNIVIHWDSVPANTLELPGKMTVHWYPTTERLIASDMSPYGGREWLNANTFDVMCLDFYGNTTLAFRSNGDRENFEVYNVRSTGLYNVNVPQLPGEVTVAEAYPYQWYIDSRSQTIDIKKQPAKDTATVHFYPKNVLKEFTFLVYDVIGAKYMIKNGGAISGMSGSYFPASHSLASRPSTILFSRVEAIIDGQNSSLWTSQDKALFAGKDPNWDSPDTLKGWTRDWIVGKFVTFGPLNPDDFRFRLTVEAISKANNHFYGSWGYQHGEWENTIASQIKNAMGQNGTLEEQLAWRQRNGGYDIIISNKRRMVVPETEGGIGNEGGFIVGVDDWGEMISAPTVGGGSNRSSALRAAINTYANLPDFVVNGIHTDGAAWSRIFNEQYVYKPESGLVWDYAPKKFWPATGMIDFYAYAPAGVKNLVKGLYNNGDNTTKPVLEYTMPYKEREEPPPGTGEPSSPLFVDDKQEDLLVAVQNRPSPHSIPVPMNFRHAFSRVTVKAKTDKNYTAYRIKVSRVDLQNMQTSGKLELKPDNKNLPYSTGIPMEATEHFKYNGTNSVTLWTNLRTPASYCFRLLSGLVAIEDEYTTLLHNDNSVFVIPQSTIGATVYVEYNVYSLSPAGGEQYIMSANKLLSLPSGFSFETGRQYELQLILNVPAK
ncbi:MAG: fimbrillin family protein [Dysgonamonadaceae bacterium]|jgi:hypothetical protein|nr:fimbrillin family protein [Dysgonamonadaceae bacterium]